MCQASQCRQATCAFLCQPKVFKHFCALRIELTKKLTELNTADVILSLLKSHAWFTCTHDYLHENQIHGQDAIWRSHYGSFLQAFQVPLRQKGMTGDPTVKDATPQGLFIHC